MFSVTYSLGSFGILFTVRFEICLFGFFRQVWAQNTIAVTAVKLCSCTHLNSGNWFLSPVCSVHQEDGGNLSNLSHSWKVVTDKVSLTWKIIHWTFQPGIASLLFNSYCLFSLIYLLSPSVCKLCYAVSRGRQWTGKAQCLQSVCCSLSLNPVCYAQVACPEFANISCLSRYSSRVGSELDMISKLSSPSGDRGNEGETPARVTSAGETWWSICLHGLQLR